MERSEIRRVVHSALEKETAAQDAGGLYADERVRSFFAQIKTLINDCFTSLYDTVRTRYSEPAEQQQKFLKGLAFIASETNEQLSTDEAPRALRDFPSLPQLYHRAMLRYAQCIAPRMTGGEVQCPPFDTFLFDVYKRVASSSEMRSGRYFSMSYLEQEIFLKDILRLTMAERVVVHDPEPVSVQVSSRGSSKSSSSRDVQPRSKPVTPYDSVSNITTESKRLSAAHAMPTGSVFSGGGGTRGSTLHNALSVASQADSLTQLSLEGRRDQRDTQRASSKKSGFKAPSIVQTRPKVVHEEKEVEIGMQSEVVKDPMQFFADTGKKRRSNVPPSEFVFEDDHSNSDTSDYE